MALPLIISPLSPSGLLILLTVCGAYSISVFQTFSGAAISMNVMDDLALSSRQLGLLGSASIYSYALSQPVTGLLLDRFGPKKILMTALGGGALGAALYAVSPSFIPAFLARAVSGFFVGMTFASGVLFLSHSFAPRHFARLSSLFMAASGLGLFLSSKVLASVTSASSWRTAFFGISLISLLWLLLAAKALPHFRNREPGDADKRQALAGGRAMILILATPQFIILALYYSCSDALYAAFTGLWAGPFLSQVYNLGDLERGSLLSWATWCFTFGALAIAFIYEKWLKNYKRLLTALALANMAIALTLVFLTAVLPHWALILLVSLAPIGAQATGLICLMGLELFPKNLSGRVLGCLNLFPILAGAVMQSLMGFIVGYGEEQGLAYGQIYSRAFVPLLALMIFSLVLSFMYTGRSRPFKEK